MWGRGEGSSDRKLQCSFADTADPETRAAHGQDGGPGQRLAWGLGACPPGGLPAALWALQEKASPLELGSRYISDPTTATSSVARPQPPTGPRSTDNEDKDEDEDEDDDDFQYPPAACPESLQTPPVSEPRPLAQESGTDGDSHGSYVNLRSQEEYENVERTERTSAAEKDKEYLMLLPSAAHRPRAPQQKGPRHQEGEDVSYVNMEDKEPKPSALDMQKADYDYVNVP
ncbi:uncharacterized protein LOC142015221 [Carettochelys insculpta]|uniref:uncharacterized protein LOC142015221 n=1 Tax=Carettochelys insculpta TaxID=44489 RepID=UPI003EBE7D3C